MTIQKVLTLPSTVQRLNGCSSLHLKWHVSIIWMFVQFQWPAARYLWKGSHVQLDQNLKWNDHVKSLLTSCYGTLSLLRKLKNLAPFYVRKNLPESLVIAKLDYASTVFYPLPQYQVDRLQRLQNACAGFVLRILLT